MKTFEADNLSGKNHAGPHPNSPAKLLTSTSILGDEVMNPNGEHLGTIKDIMIDLHTGTIEYVIIEFGGFLGIIGEKYFALPYAMLKLNPKDQVFILDQSKDTLQNAPGFDKEHWPETNTHLYDSNAYWGGFMGANSGSVPY
jgi:sporulation protein YlmC with PRC-barrel domain